METKAKDTCRNLGTDAAAGRKRRITVARARLKVASARANRLQRLSAVGVNLSKVQRAGPTVVATWSGPVTGLTDTNLHGLQMSSLKARGRLPRGASLGLRIQASKATRRLDPFKVHDG